MAETFRRGAELLLEVYPPHPGPVAQTWTPPSSADVGWNDLNPAELKNCVEDDREPELQRIK
ncbi:MAG: hypothetical protein GVY36_04375 [Verrucomicrobia bacterium]|jgi:hypothetical protein|nr:hypothetical protein [Verrucomicrobiota bacterium]